MAITTIIFDLAEVLLYGFYGVEKSLAPILKLDSETIVKKLREDGKITEEEYWSSIVQKNNWNFN